MDHYWALALRNAFRNAWSQLIGSRFAKPIARATLLGGGLLALAAVGRTAVASAVGSPQSPLASASAAPWGDPSAPLAPTGVARVEAVAPAGAGPPAGSMSSNTLSGDVAGSPTSRPVSSVAPRVSASPDDPVVLNHASMDDLRRLPGIGPKRADAILALRERMGGRFRAIEDLLKVRGIGRATLKRLRPLVRLDPPPDGGVSRSATAPLP